MSKRRPRRDCHRHRLPRGARRGAAAGRRQRARPARRDRSKLFMPYYSTKGRGSGLGLAIVRRIIAEHGGSIEAADNTARHVLHHRTARLIVIQAA